MTEKENPFGNDMEKFDLRNQPEEICDDQNTAMVNAFLDYFESGTDWKVWKYEVPEEINQEIEGELGEPETFEDDITIQQSTWKLFWQVFLKSNLFPQVISNPDVNKDWGKEEDANHDSSSSQ